MLIQQLRVWGRRPRRGPGTSCGARLRVTSLISWFMAMCCVAPAAARTLAELNAEGYIVRAVLSVDGDFHGCDTRSPIRFVGGSEFECRLASFTYLHEPLAFVLVNPATLDTVLSIGGEEYAGRLRGVERLGRRIDTGTGPLRDANGASSVRLMPDEADAPTRGGLLAITGLDQPVPGR